MNGNDSLDPYERWMLDNDYKIVWECQMCGFRYESEPGVNEAMICPNCHEPTDRAGETYHP